MQLTIEKHLVHASRSTEREANLERSRERLRTRHTSRSLSPQMMDDRVRLSTKHACMSVYLKVRTTNSCVRSWLPGHHRLSDTVSLRELHRCDGHLEEHRPGEQPL